MLAMTGEAYEECVPGCDAKFLGDPVRARARAIPTRFIAAS